MKKCPAIGGLQGIRYDCSLGLLGAFLTTAGTAVSTLAARTTLALYIVVP